MEAPSAAHSPETRMTPLYRLALATLLAALALIALGSVARLHPAGAGCGNDWPRCHGSWLPPLAWEPLVEYAHRAAALAVVALAAATTVAAFRTAGAGRKTRLLATAGLAALLVQSLIGAAAARWGAPPGIAIAHLLTAMLFLAGAVATLAVVAARRGQPRWLAALGHAPAPDADRLLAAAATLGAVVALLLLLFGASTSASGAFACAAWPLCGDETGAPQPATVIHLGYRATALLGTLAAAGAAMLAWRRRASQAARILAATAVALVVIQSGLNAASALAGDPVWMSAPHLVVATLFWLTMAAVSLAAWGPRPALAVRESSPVTAGASGAHSILDRPAASHPGASGALAVAVARPPLAFELPRPSLARARQIVADYVALTKPGILTLLLTTTLCAMLMAARGLPPFWLVVVTMLGGILAAGGANVLNCYIDRDIDGQMSRTRHRAIAAGRISPEAALTFGVTLTVASVLLFGLVVNWTAAALALAGNLFYVLVYTKWLKRSTAYNIVIGGAAGAAPPLVGWAAVTGDLSPLAWGLFAIVFAWTPPHFWALALLKQGEYTRAAVPMLPVVRGEAETRLQIVLYTAVLFLVSLALAPLGLGGIYLGAALLLNGIFLWLALRLALAPSKRIARQIFFFSLWYLALLFAAAVVDRIVLV
jgi:protoheme IX farnesyltransferase